MITDFVEFLTDDQLKKVQDKILEKIIKSIEDCDIDLSKEIKQHTEYIYEHVFEECDLSGVQEVATDFLTKKIKAGLV